MICFLGIWTSTCAKGPLAVGPVKEVGKCQEGKCSWLVVRAQPLVSLEVGVLQALALFVRFLLRSLLEQAG